LIILHPGVWGFRCSINLVNLINYVSKISLTKFVLFLLMGKRKACQAYVASIIINRKAESNHCKPASRDPGDVYVEEAWQTAGGKGVDFWNRSFNKRILADCFFIGTIMKRPLPIVERVYFRSI